MVTVQESETVILDGCKCNKTPLTPECFSCTKRVRYVARLPKGSVDTIKNYGICNSCGNVHPKREMTSGQCISCHLEEVS